MSFTSMTVIKLAQFEVRGISSFIFTTTKAKATDDAADDKNHKIMRLCRHDIMIFNIWWGLLPTCLHCQIDYTKVRKIKNS